MLGVKKKVSEDEARVYISEIILAIEHLHSLGIIYRNLNPDNIMIAEDGHLKIIDFGLSKENANSKYANKFFLLTYFYQTPEVLMRKPHGKSLDWYLLGALLYELIVGVPPYFNPNSNIMKESILNGPLKIPRSLSKEA
jgi:serine/threonine protein kinase